MPRLATILSATIIALSFPAARADQVDLIPVRDNTLYESTTGALSNGAGSFLFAGLTGGQQIRRAVLAFDVAGSIPEWSTIDEVRLTMNCSRVPIPIPFPVSLHRVTSSWGEGTSDAPDNEGQGAPATEGDATWIHREFDQVFWSTAGGDFVATASGQGNVQDIGSYTWESEPGMVEDVQLWLDDPAVNHGWIVIVGDETQPGSSKRFDSRENPTVANRPVLEVSYTPIQVAVEPVGWGRVKALYR